MLKLLILFHLSLCRTFALLQINTKNTKCRRNRSPASLGYSSFLMTETELDTIPSWQMKAQVTLSFYELAADGALKRTT